MEPLSAPSTGAQEERRHSSSRRFRRRLDRIWRGWWVEIVIVCLVALALFLLFEQMNIRETLRSGLFSLLDGLKDLARSSLVWLRQIVSRTSLSDLAAYLILLAVQALILWRARSRLMASARLADLHCPVCGAGLRRVHRRWHERLLSTILPVRRYRCLNDECGWGGLRIRQQS